MLGARLLLLIQSHAGPLTTETLQDLRTNERTPTFRRLRAAEVESRIAQLFNNLAKWIGDPNDDAVRREYEEMGRTRFREGVPVSELTTETVSTKASHTACVNMPSALSGALVEAMTTTSRGASVGGVIPSSAATKSRID